MPHDKPPEFYNRKRTEKGSCAPKLWRWLCARKTGIASVSHLFGFVMRYKKRGFKLVLVTAVASSP